MSCRVEFRKLDLSSPTVVSSCKSTGLRGVVIDMDLLLSLSPDSGLWTSTRGPTSDLDDADGSRL